MNLESFLFVKINCPHCSRAYELDPLKMPSPKYNEMQESWGWKFECGACDHHWWLKLSNFDESSRKRNGTDGYYTEEDLYYNNFRDPRAEPYTKKSHTGSLNNYAAREEVRNLPVLAPKRESEPSQKLSAPPLPRQNINHALYRRKDDTSSFFWMTIILLLTILGSVVYTYHDVFYQKWLSLKITNSISMQKSAFSLPLSIQQVHWDKATMPDGTIKVAVVGEVFNNNEMTSRLRPLHLVAWGPCNQGEIPPEKCMLGGFEYNFQKATILPQERIAFQASWALPKNSTVPTAVNVTMHP